MATEDLREQLCNERKTGTFAEVQLPLERVTSLHGIMFDLDPRLYVPGNTIFPPAADPRAFYAGIKPVLDRHPLAKYAEIRMTGTGLHALVLLDPPVELNTAAEQAWWDCTIRAVQGTLPADPHAPGITALTRPVGSINFRNDAMVEMIRRGEPVDPTAVGEFLRRFENAPFKEMASILLGGTDVRPCPICRGENSRLDVLDRVGRCYARCGNIHWADVYDAVYVPPDKQPKTPTAPQQADATDGAADPKTTRKRSPGRRRPRTAAASDKKSTNED